MQVGTITTESSHGRVVSVGRTPAGCHFGLGSSHYVKTSNRSRNICNGPLTPVTSTHICNSCCLAPVTYKRARTTLGWPPQCPLLSPLIGTQCHLFSHIGDACCYLVCVSVSYPFDTTRSLSAEARPLLFLQQHRTLFPQKVTRSICVLRCPCRPIPFATASCARS
jgi:hypothetical protein